MSIALTGLSIRYRY